MDSGTQKKAYFEDINETVQATNDLIFAPVIESGVDTTIPIQEIYGVLRSCSKSQKGIHADAREVPECQRPANRHRERTLSEDQQQL